MSNLFFKMYNQEREYPYLYSCCSSYVIYKSKPAILGGSLKQLFKNQFLLLYEFNQFVIFLRKIEYVKNQEVHHYKKSFREEFIDLLKEHSVVYDEKYLQ
jgi:hypothetical protein